MKGGGRSILLLALCVTAALAGPDASAAKNWRQEYAAFLALPAEIRERVRRLDRDLQEEDPEYQVALHRVMQRYLDWLERLSPEERKLIEQAKSTEEKLQRIREVREKQWVRTLPKADRDQIESTTGPDERKKRIAAAREREYNREVDWLFGQARVGEAPEQLREEISKLVMQLRQKQLNAQETQQLRELQGKGPAYLKLLVDLCKKHDVPISGTFRRLWAEQEANPPVGRQKLLHFFLTKLSDSERKLFDARFRDPEQQEQARQELEKRYWQEHPDELARVREFAKRKKEKPRPGKP
jgi:hypothetical protein